MLSHLTSLRPIATCLGALALTQSITSGLEPGGLLIAEGRFGGKLEVVSHDVDVVIRDGIAVTTFEEVFRNTESRELEALYTFPVPENASVANFSMWIAGKEMIGEVVEKERARQIYESYKRRGVDPGLLEQVDAARFEMRIYPIAAGAEQRVRVTYYQELDVDADWATYVYPLATTSDGQRPDSTVHGRFSLNLETYSDLPIVEMTSPSHADSFVMSERDLHLRQASLEQVGGDLARDVVVAFRTKRAPTGVDVVASTPEGEDGFFQLTLTAGDELASSGGSMDFVFVSDVSGSMAHEGKLGLSNSAVEAFLDVLGPDDRVDLIRFHVEPKPLYGNLVAVDTEVQARAERFLDEQRARGGTNLAPALRLAYDYADPDRQLNVVLLSDGLTEARERANLVRLMAERPSGVRVFCVGIGNDVDRPLLKQLAHDAGGLAEFVSRGDDFQRQAKAFRRKLTRPAMENVSITLTGVETYAVAPRSLGNVFHGAPLRIYGRNRKAGPLNVTLRATIDGRSYEQQVGLELPKVARDHPEIERMWAWHHVQELENQVRSGVADDRTIEDIVMLCEGYSIPGQRASFLVLENDAEYRRWKIARRNATRIERDRGAQQRLRNELDRLKSRAPAARRKVQRASNVPASIETVLPKRAEHEFAPPSTPSSTSNRPARQGPSGGGALDLWSAMLVGLLLIFVVRRR